MTSPLSSMLQEPSPADAQNDSACLERAGLLLDKMLRLSEEELGAVTDEFERLAAQIDSVLQMTAGLVTCVEEDCARSILPMARALGAAAGHFIQHRIESVAHVTELFTSEEKMLERLSSLARAQIMIGRRVKVLGILSSIEVARLGKTGGGFEYMARELDEFSAVVSSGAEDVRLQTDQRRASLHERGTTLKRSLERMRERSASIKTELGEATASMDLAVADLARIPSQFKDCVASVAERISRVVAAVQMHDVTRQQMEHVRDALRLISAEREGGAQGRSDAARRAAMLTVQMQQLKSVRTSTVEWIEEIDSCLEALVCIGSSEIASTGARILEQEQNLSQQLCRIDELEREAAPDDAAIELCMAGLSELMNLVRTHLDRSHGARDHMHLLNFNSMVEAAHLGAQAAVVLEIARNISRVSAEWNELTTRSSEAMEELLQSSAGATEMARASAQENRENLARAQQESRTGIAALKEAAASATGGSSEIEAAVSGLHGEISSLRSLVEPLRESAALLERALDEIACAAQQCGEYDPLDPAAFDRRELEEACMGAYTTELERQVLRSALYGEAMLRPAAPMAGNDVELF